MTVSTPPPPPFFSAADGFGIARRQVLANNTEVNFKGAAFAALVWLLTIVSLSGAERKSKSKEPLKEVEVFQNGALPDRTFKELEAFTDDITRPEEPEITRKFVKKAQALGADALIVFPLEKSGVELAPFRGFKETFAYRASAVRFTGPSGSALRMNPTQEPPAYSNQPPANPELSGSGTGFFITKDGYLVTNDHVVKGAAKVKLIIGQKIIDADIVRTDPANDLALLKAEGSFEALPIDSSRGVKLGDAVLTVGFPRPGTQGLEPKLTRGDISGLAGLHDNPHEFQISNPIQPGNSGGALVNRSGNVVGVIKATLNPLKTLSDGSSLPQNVNYAVKSTYLNAFLESVPKFPNESLLPPLSGERPDREVIDQTVAATVQVLNFR